MINKLKNFLTTVFALANYDFCPGANRYAYVLKKPIAWVVIGIFVSLTAGIMIGPQGYVLALAFFALLILGLAWPWISMKGIKCELVVRDGRVWENHEVGLLFRVQNFWPLPIFGLIVEGDFLQDDDADEKVAFSLRKVPAWSETNFSVSITPHRRGIFPQGQVHVKNGFPFGLVDISRAVTLSRTSLVWPGHQALDGQPSTNGTRTSITGVLEDVSGNEGETIGVRAYQHGDRLRNVHWAQSVRSHQLMVRERQSRCSISATIFLDLSAGHHKGRGVYSSFEWAIRFAGTICYQLHLNRNALKLVCAGLPNSIPISMDNHSGIQRLMDYLSRLPTFDELRQIESTESVTLQQVFANYRKSGNQFLIGTDRTFSVAGDQPSIQPIVIDADGFSGMPSKNGNGFPTVAKGNSDIYVTSPDNAMHQFSGQWNRRYQSAAS